jgi:plasmid stabilization system protein ParE
MPQISISAQARFDLNRLYNFLAEKDIGVAERAIEEIDKSFIPLSQMPKMGRIIEHGLREYIIDFGSSGYIALYDFHEDIDKIVILAIKHQLELDYKLIPDE